ncbi:MAG: hypothetical protein WC903_08490 [Candidatus Margulisiibacteriota bacterium]
MNSEPLVRYGLPGLLFFAGILMTTLFINPSFIAFIVNPNNLAWNFAAIIAASFLPLGWLFYNSFRFWFDLIGGDYESTDAMKLIRDKISRTEYGDCLKIDISKVTQNNSAITKVFYVGKDQYNILFDPYRFLKYFIFSYRWWKGVEEYFRPRIKYDYIERWAFTEHILHLTFFKDSSLAEYTRGFAGTVNGLLAGGYAFIFGIYFAYFARSSSATINPIITLIMLGITILIVVPIILFWIVQIFENKLKIFYSFMPKLIISIMIISVLCAVYGLTNTLLLINQFSTIPIYLGLFVLFITNIYSGYLCKNENDARLLLSSLIAVSENKEGGQ